MQFTELILDHYNYWSFWLFWCCYFSDTLPPFIRDILSDFLFYRVFGNSKDRNWSEPKAFNDGL